MKLYAYDKDGTVVFRTTGHNDTIGTIEITESPKPKQTVTKEARMLSDVEYHDYPFVAHFHVEQNAKNIRCTYEVEE